MLGDGYAETLRKVYKDVPDTVDFVMYWWHKAAELVRALKISRFGLITTNTISQVRQRKVIDFHQSQNNPIQLFFAIPDHPWVDRGAAVRIAMTGTGLNTLTSKRNIELGTVIDENENEIPEKSADEIRIQWHIGGNIFSNLQLGIDVTKATKLESNKLLAGPGVKLHGAGFLVTEEEMKIWGNTYLGTVIKHYCNGRDLVGNFRQLFVIDFFGLSQSEASLYDRPFQKVLEEVKPERDVNKRKIRKENWWLFGENVLKTRDSLKKISRYIATPETAKHRVFVFLNADVLPDNMVTAIALDDAYFLGVLSTSIHAKWCLANGGSLGVYIGNIRYNKTRCFDPFPFPDPTDTQKQTIRELGERLDRHRKRVQATHPEVTITGMYNLLEKLRQGEPLDDKDKAFNQKALVSTLKQIHDELDVAVFAAYGWEPTLTDEQILENLVTLNAQRAAEERNGLIRWLRPDYQAPGETYIQPSLAGIATETETAIVPTEQQPFPKTLKEQLSAIRDLFRTQSGEWTAAQVTAHFKGANRKQKVILECLESLEDLGILLSHAENGMTFWHLAEVEKAG